MYIGTMKKKPINNKNFKENVYVLNGMLENILMYLN